MTVQRKSLKKDLSLFSLFFLATGTIIGVGWITVLGVWLGQAGSLGAVLGFVIGGFIMLVIGLCYAEAATMYPVSGGEVAYIYEMFGIRWSFVAGWFLALEYIGITAFEAISVGWVLSAMFPGFGGPVLYTILGHGVQLWSLVAGLGIMAGVILVNYRGAKAVAIFQTGMTFALLSASLVFIVVGVTWGDTANLDPMFQGVGYSGALIGILAVVATAPFWFGGFDIIPQAMGEVKDGTQLKMLPRVIVLAITVAAAFYGLVIIAASMTLPREQLLSYELPMAGALVTAFQSEWLGKLVLFAGLMGLITTWNAIFFAASRVVFALGRAHMIPSIFAKVHDRFGSPHIAVLFVGLVGAIGTFFGRNAILPIVSASALILSSIFVLIVIGVARLRKRLPDHPRPYKAPGGNLFLAFAALCAVFVTFLAIYGPLKDAEGRVPQEWYVLAVWALLGGAFWLLARPVRKNISEADRRYLMLNESKPEA